MSLAESIQTCYLMCGVITDAGVSDTKRINLKDSLRFDWLKFCVHLCYADKDITPDEMAFIRDTLGYRLSKENLMDFIRSGSVGPDYGQQIPPSLKYFVLADAYNHKKTVTLISTYEELGRGLLAAQTAPSRAGVEALSSYIKMLDKFIQEYGLFRNTNRRIIQPTANTNRTSENTDSPNSAGASNRSPENTGESSANLEQDVVDKLLADLNALVGLEGVKREVNSLVSLLRVQ